MTFDFSAYRFNGDVVDRGSFSVECILLLFGFKLLYPNHLFVARGNHESETMNKIFGFEGEVKNKYSQQLYDVFAEVFEYLPLAHLIQRENDNGKVIVMHGGLFNKDDVTLDDIRKVDRVRQPPEEGLMCDLLWSDPMANLGRSPSKRGVGVQFGPDVTQSFLKLNNVDYVIRSHEVKENGYEVVSHFYKQNLFLNYKKIKFKCWIAKYRFFSIIFSNQCSFMFLTFCIHIYFKCRPMMESALRCSVHQIIAIKWVTLVHSSRLRVTT